MTMDGTLAQLRTGLEQGLASEIAQKPSKAAGSANGDGAGVLISRANLAQREDLP
jgi:hypothetical protein